jgi:hypothetical protein
MGIQEIIAISLLIIAIFFISRKLFFSFKQKSSGDGCKSCGCEPGTAKKSEIKA